MCSKDVRLSEHYGLVTVVEWCDGAMMEFRSWLFDKNCIIYFNKIYLKIIIKNLI